ncbi:hypothetical protein ACFX13_001911 [Malus domestica]|uniref:probable protein phosphatase 2C 75 n=1 Tax=Malus domestica TaxID=3750 RepID=UPI000498BF97|nr:probable protein phosphatase 2C 75 [Malus domestica]XP_050138823.1 probable protein phosphatase 2C 75 [Malus sylvestris]
MTRQRAELVSWKMRLRKEWMFDTPEQCRDRRRRRIEMRRAKWSSSGYRPLPVRGAQHISNDHDQTCLILSDEEDGGPTDHEVAVQPAVPSPRYLLHRNPMPEFRTMSFSRLPDQMGMELNDTVFVKEDFCRLDHVLHGQPIHFFAVYDGHGHPHVSTVCKQRMHEFVAEELRRVFTTVGCANGDENMNFASQGQEEARWPALVPTALERSFQRMHRLAQDTCPCGNIGHACGCKPNINALPVAGSTAVVAILTAQHIVIANCGFSHAVLGRAGRPFPLSHYHKLQSERWNEQERMRAVDGRMFYHNGVRVYGTLNMNHSPNPIEHIYKPVVTLEPRISLIKREGDQDEFLILANDGLWDVVPDDMACRVACMCLRGGGGGGSSGHMNRATAPNTGNVEHCLCPPNTDGHENARGGVFLSPESNLAATLLCRLALARGSHGDISVMVVDLKSG